VCWFAHQQGFKLPVKDYWEFVDLVSANTQKVHSLQDYLHILHTVTAHRTGVPGSRLTRACSRVESAA
jgi:hypothetical protein